MYNNYFAHRFSFIKRDYAVMARNIGYPMWPFLTASFQVILIS